MTRKSKQKRLRENQKEKRDIYYKAEAEHQHRIYEGEDPQKQYIRRYGWLEVVEQYVNRREVDGVNSPIKFLTMPGEPAKDIGLLWKAGLLFSDDNGLFNFAICDEVKAEIVERNLSGLGTLLASSNRLLHNELSDTESDLRKHFPFDVINLDFTNPLVPSQTTDNLQTLEWIYRLQQGQRFLLLVTTRADRSGEKRLLPNLNRNLNNLQFRQTYFERFGSYEGVVCLKDYTNFLQIVYPKIIARRASKYNYRTHERFAAKYWRPRGRRSYFMISHSFEFEPYNQDIAQGSIEIFTNQVDEDYLNFTLNLVNRDPINVRRLLDDDSELETTLRTEARNLDEWWIKV